MATRNGRALLTREDWARAALGVIAERGVAAVTVDELARALGATRGSFYWHYHSHEELIVAAVQLWARESTTELLPKLEAIQDPVKRLRALLRSVYQQPLSAAELMLSVAGDDPLVAPVYARVTRQRMNALRRIFTELGMAPAEAADQAWLAYAFYIGHHQLRKNPEIAARRPASIDRMARLLAGGLTR